MKTTVKNPINYKGESLTPESLLEKYEKLALCITDEKGYFVEVNAAYLELYGYQEKELIGKHFTIVVPEENRAFAAKVHDEFIAGTTEMPAEWTVQRKDGELIQIRAEAIRCEDPNGRPAKITIIERIA
ncbi:MAG: PAS domain-containing protein [Bacteroidia bacterium]|nr:PAS domain-containing protein [Bacteroidia bacterium]MDW8157552.1 PAS domain-containing protein [Bacteroidia bacterium]